MEAEASKEFFLIHHPKELVYGAGCLAILQTDWPQITLQSQPLGTDIAPPTMEKSLEIDNVFETDNQYYFPLFELVIIPLSKPSESSDGCGGRPIPTTNFLLREGQNLKIQICRHSNEDQPDFAVSPVVIRFPRKLPAPYKNIGVVATGEAPERQSPDSATL